jgi:diguanylate cyclase (GGDEF)-like protein
LLRYIALASWWMTMNPRPFTLLLVSPDRTALRRLSKFLDVFGYDVRQATDPAQALAAAEAARPDFLIVDGSSGQPADLQLCGSVRRIWTQGYTYALLLAERPEVGDITAALEQGFDDFLSAPIVYGELLARLRAGARVIEFERRLSEHAGVDPVTGLPGKAALTTELHRRSQRGKGVIGWLAVIDVDYFRRVADRFGRAAAEDLLKQVAKHVRECCGSDYFAATLGADHIAIALPASGSEAAESWCVRTLRGLAEATFNVGQAQHRVTASCGLTEINAGEALEVIHARVRRAVQLAKASGRNCVITSTEVDKDAEQWTTLAADGKLFQTTLARDVMHPCPLLLHLDETLDQAHALLQQTGLAHAPVVDAEGKLAGIVSLDELGAAKVRQPKPRGGSQVSHSSVRLVRHVMKTEVTRFDEGASLGELMEFFTGDSATLAIIVRDKRPLGLVHCHALAAFNERLTADHFACTKPRTGTSEDLLVPDLAMAE